MQIAMTYTAIFNRTVGVGVVFFSDFQQRLRCQKMYIIVNYYFSCVICIYFSSVVTYLENHFLMNMVK